MLRSVLGDLAVAGILAASASAAPIGTVITIDITAAGSIGKEVRFTIRKRHLPSSRTYCFPVGSTHAHTHC
jgi:hypothetical protein